MEEGTSTKEIQCPICSKEYSPSTIEAHVSKCLFLNESSKKNDRSSNFLKRPHSGSDRPLAKSPGTRVADKKFTKVDDTTGKTSNVVRKNQQESISTETLDKVREKESRKTDHVPLAEKMRPTSLKGYVGQSHVLGQRGMLLNLLKKGEIPNIILWGPPGCGKTSLANVISGICKESPGNKYRYVKLSAAMSGVPEVKEFVKIASNELKFGRRTVMFMDEIHRFNKAQQDIFLPHVENGTIILIGATTENPSFSLNSALLSRCRVIVLEKLSTTDLVDILSRAVRAIGGKMYHSDNGELVSGTGNDQSDANVPRFLIDSKTIEWLGETCDGDARVALGGLELAVGSVIPSDEEVSAKGLTFISLEDIKDGLKKTHTLYDRKGEQHYDTISALHKSVRASDENASLYWLARMMAGGEDPVYIARRLVRMACEDIGLEDPKALGVAVNTMQGCKMLGMPECDVLLAQCVTYLARAPKSRLMEDALRAAQKLVADQKGSQPGVPLHLRNAPTRLMGDLGYGRGYNMLHREESGLNYLPAGLEYVDFFQESNG